MSDVYFTSFKGLTTEERITSFSNIVEHVGMKMINADDSVAIKVHFGEPGCTTFVKPELMKPALDYIKNLDAKPFLTDSNTLYKGKRSNGKDHRESALKHGFSEDNIGVPIVIADGDDSTEIVEKMINKKYFKSIKYGMAVDKADSLVVISHFKGHLLFGFGGALKNVGMGFGSRSAKQMMHADVKPELVKEKCTSCGTCEQVCPVEAIEMVDGFPIVDYDTCDGCAECIAMCPEDALKIQWDGSALTCMEKTAETCYAILSEKKEKSIFYNFIIDVTPDCDCFPQSDAPIVGDIGVVVSTDPVAIDAASLFLVNQEEGRKDSNLKNNFNTGEDKFMGLRPNIDGNIILKYAEKLGLGSMNFKIVEI